jgi:hypothetical protein
VYVLIAGWDAMAEHLQELRDHVEQPDLRHPGPGIDGQPGLAVCHNRGIGHFDDQIDVLRLRMRARIEIGAWAQQYYIRLGLRILGAQEQGVLYPDNRLCPKP